MGGKLLDFNEDKITAERALRAPETSPRFVLKKTRI